MFTGGRIVTMDPRRPEVDVVLVEHGRIAAVGGPELAEGWPDAAVVDVTGRSVLPGFIDAHNHLGLASLIPRWANLSDAADLDTVAERIRDQALREPDAAWIRATGWERCGPVPLDRRDLDSLGLARPILVEHFSIHQAVVDSRGLDELGIGPGTPDPSGGEIERDEAGRPTGMLRERAWGAAQEASLAAYADPSRWDELIVERARTLLADGITAVHDAACPPAAEAAYARLAAAGRLPVSVLAMPHPAAILSLPDTDRLAGPPTGEGDEWLRVGPLKLFADGGAHLSIDGTSRGRPIHTGYRFPDIVAAARAATERGFRVAVHAMGNTAIDRAVDAFRDMDRAGAGDHRPRLEHATLASAEQIGALASLGAVAVVQPGFVETLGANVRDLVVDGASWMPFADLDAAGVPLAASSDDPCSPRHPLLTSRSGVTRLTAPDQPLGTEQSLPYERWLRAWTSGAAHAGGQEAERGTLEVGKRADLVVVDGDLDAEADPIVDQTWVAGELGFER